MKDTFDAYDYVAVIAPGAFVAVPLLAAWPELNALVGQDFDISDLGLFLVFSFGVGHLVQALGNILEEALWWLTGGLPTERVLRAGSGIISDDQRTAVGEKIKARYTNFALKDVGADGWRGHIREIYSALAAAEKAGQVDRLNRIYGMLRGLAAAMFILGIWALISGDAAQALIAFSLAAIGLWRMQRFGRYYARELFAAYLTLS
jgi:hypothetical protein